MGEGEQPFDQPHPPAQPGLDHALEACRIAGAHAPPPPSAAAPATATGRAADPGPAPGVRDCAQPRLLGRLPPAQPWQPAGRRRRARLGCRPPAWRWRCPRSRRPWHRRRHRRRLRRTRRRSSTPRRRRRSSMSQVRVCVPSPSAEATPRTARRLGAGEAGAEPPVTWRSRLSVNGPISSNCARLDLAQVVGHLGAGPDPDEDWLVAELPPA